MKKLEFKIDIATNRQKVWNDGRPNALKRLKEICESRVAETI